MMAASVQLDGVGEELYSESSVQWGLAHAAEYCRALASALPDSTVVVLAPDETILAAEGELIGRGGHDPRRVVGMRHEEIVPPSTYPALRERFYATLSDGPQSFDYRTADGQRLCWIHETAMYLGTDSPVAVIAVVQDVTGRHRLTAELEIERE